MAELSMSILGLGRVGVSLAMALQRYNNQPNSNNHFTITGYDPLPSVRQRTNELGVFDTLTGNLKDAANGRDLVVLAMPFSQIQDTIKTLGGILQEGAVIFDLSPLKRPVLSWSAEYLPDGVFVVGGSPILNPVYLWDGLDSGDHAHEDLFDNGAFLLAPAPKADREAVTLVNQMVDLLGVPTHFVDPDEHDGAVAITEGVPTLLSLALFRAATRSKGWQESQRLTNPAFGRHTHQIMDTHPDDLRDLTLANRQNVLHQLNNVIAQLVELRDVLQEDDADAIDAAFSDSENRYRDWLKQRSSGKWNDALDNDTDDKASMTGSFLSGMLGGYLADRLQGKNKKD